MSILTLTPSIDALQVAFTQVCSDLQCISDQHQQLQARVEHLESRVSQSPAGGVDLTRYDVKKVDLFDCESREKSVDQQPTNQPVKSKSVGLELQKPQGKQDQPAAGVLLEPPGPRDPEIAAIIDRWKARSAAERAEAADQPVEGFPAGDPLADVDLDQLDLDLADLNLKPESDPAAAAKPEPELEPEPQSRAKPTPPPARPLKGPVRADGQRPEVRVAYGMRLTGRVNQHGAHKAVRKLIEDPTEADLRDLWRFCSQNGLDQGELDYAVERTQARMANRKLSLVELPLNYLKKIVTNQRPARLRAHGELWPKHWRCDGFVPAQAVKEKTWRDSRQRAA